jgi:uncharacterized protein YbbC (DUF1343 family)
MALGVAMLIAAREVSSNVAFSQSTFDGLAGTDQVRSAIELGQPAEDVINAWEPELNRFRATRERYLLY